MTSVLELVETTTRRGRVQVLNGCSLTVAKGEVVALLGPNGAGKSTLLGTVMGLYPSPTGQVIVQGQEITRVPTHRRIHYGLALVPERRQIFAHLTVEDNLQLGAFHRRRHGVGISRDVAEGMDLFPGLLKHRHRQAGWLSGGEQQMVAIGRALMARLEILLLDEPTLGLAPVIVKEVFEALARLKDSGLTILIVEQNVSQALALASRAYIMVHGQMVFKGSSAEAHHALAEGYLAMG
ncbi:MAG: ABC transporter ATP-binding protein [Firmicutes bacterium]|nr:ABC transporter ATP-binding protein [Bacillota bacterium]